MKKLLFLLSLLLMLNGCKQKQAAPTIGNKKILPLTGIPQVDCHFFDSLELLTVVNQVAWLREHQSQACLEQYDECRENAHQLSPENYNRAISTYWAGGAVVYSDYTVAEIKSKTTDTGYEKFLSMTVKDDHITPDATNDFSLTPVCFSIPLFYSIQRLYGLKDTDTFRFTTGTINGKQTVVFSVDATAHFYDVGHYPL